jgi:hypothetical protein
VTSSNGYWLLIHIIDEEEMKENPQLQNLFQNISPRRPRPPSRREEAPRRLQSPEKKRPQIQNRGQNPMRPPAEGACWKQEPPLLTFFATSQSKQSSKLDNTVLYLQYSE